jgi:hypothetical protein
MNQHYDEALKIIRGDSDQLEGSPAPTEMMLTIDANTHATLALAYEQRTANLIAYLSFCHSHPAANAVDLGAKDIRERLGLK